MTERARLLAFGILWSISGASLSCGQSGAAGRLERDLDAIRHLLHGAGLSAAVARDGEILWSDQWGASDREMAKPVSDNTLFPIFSITKTMTAVLLMRQVERGVAHLDQPMADYHADRVTPPEQSVRHVASHLGDGIPGSEYLYNGERFSSLAEVLSQNAGVDFRQQLENDIFEPLGLRDTFAGLGPLGAARRDDLLARPYRWDSVERRVVSGTPVNSGVDSSWSVISTAQDVARYGSTVPILLKKSSWDEMLTPVALSTGELSPHGIGWFTQNYLGEAIAWHCGQEESFSSILIRPHSDGPSFAALANTNVMSDDARLLDGNIARSLPALAFLRSFVVADLVGDDCPAVADIIQDSTLTPNESAACRAYVEDVQFALALAHVHLGHRQEALDYSLAAFEKADPRHSAFLNWSCLSG